MDIPFREAAEGVCRDGQSELLLYILKGTMSSSSRVSFEFGFILQSSFLLILLQDSSYILHYENS
jgi:hypothetical protein